MSINFGIFLVAKLTMKQKTIISAILAGGIEREKCLSYIYETNFSQVYSMINKHVLTKEEVLDAYSDSIILFRDQVIKGAFKGTARYSTYLYSILNNRCIDIIRNKSTNKSKQRENESGIDYLEEHANLGENIIDLLSRKVQWDLLDRLMDRLWENCKGILLDWNNGYSMAEIAERNGLLNEHTARTKRYNCLKQLMELVNKSALVYR